MTKEEAFALEPGDVVESTDDAHCWGIEPGVEGTVVEPGVYVSEHNGLTYVTIEWDDKLLPVSCTGFGIGGLIWYAKLVKKANQAPKTEQSYNTMCKRCGNPAFMLFTTIECPKCGAY